MQVSDKLSKVNDSFTVNMYDNGYMVEIGGRDDNDNWVNAKLLCNTFKDLVSVIEEISSMSRD